MWDATSCTSILLSPAWSCLPQATSPCMVCCARKLSLTLWPFTIIAGVCSLCLEFRLLDLELTFTYVLQVQIHCKSDKCVCQASRRRSILWESSDTERALIRRLSLKQLGHVSGQNTSQTFGEYTNYQSYSHRGSLCFHLCFSGDVSGSHGPARWARFCWSQLTIKLGPGKTFKIEADG